MFLYKDVCFSFFILFDFCSLSLSFLLPSSIYASHQPHIPIIA
jgi:hypothetical protein